MLALWVELVILDFHLWRSTLGSVSRFMDVGGAPVLGGRARHRPRTLGLVGLKEMMIFSSSGAGPGL